jgi:uncharacterized protein
MPHSLKLSRYVVVSDPLYSTRNHFNGYLIFSTRSGAIVTLDRQDWEHISNQRYERFTPAAINKLLDTEILIPAEQDELSTVVQENRRAIAAADTLYEVVQPTAWCQLDCSYCGQEHSKHQMSQSHQADFLQRMRARLASGGYRHVKLGWFGAEPLVGLSVIRSLTPKIRALATEFACDYSATIVSNGLGLTAAIAAELADLHAIVSAEVTLDGLAADHDRTRYTKNGKGSFERIFANLLGVANTTALRLSIRCNVGRTNADGVAPLIEALAAQGLARHVTFYTSPIYDWGNDAHRSALDRDDYASREVEWLVLQARLGFQVGLIPPRRKIVCLSVQRDAEVADAYGTVYNCTEMPYMPTAVTQAAHQIRIPIFANGQRQAGGTSLAARLPHFNEQLLAGEHQQCAACVMLPVCGGHCPKSWEEQQPPCPSAKHNMRERLNIVYALSQQEASIEC